MRAAGGDIGAVQIRVAESFEQLDRVLLDGVLVEVPGHYADAARARSASPTRSSPEISLGSSASRK